MARRTLRETRQRGPGGWFFLILFWGFNALMAWVTLRYWQMLSYRPTPDSDAEMTGMAVGATLATGTILFFWVAGAVIFGLFALLTRGRKIVVEEIDP